MQYSCTVLYIPSVLYTNTGTHSYSCASQRDALTDSGSVMVFVRAVSEIYSRNGWKFSSKDVGLKALKLAKMPIVHLGWLKKYFSGNTGHSD